MKTKKGKVKYVPSFFLEELEATKKEYRIGELEMSDTEAFRKIFGLVQLGKNIKQEPNNITRTEHKKKKGFFDVHFDDL